MRIQEFAKQTGVTVRTLHHYDRLGLLQPQRTVSGYRIYGERELIRLQRITVLKFIGCSLQDIKELLDRDPDDLRNTLDLQQEALESRRKALDGALKAVDQAKGMLSKSGKADWQSLKQIVETIEMEENMEWTKQYYSPEALQELAKRRDQDPNVAEHGQRDWAILLADCEQALKDKVDPKSDHGQQLAHRWIELVQAFTKGNPQIAQGLNKLYADQQNWPTTFKRPWSGEVDAFIREAKNATNLRCQS
jgi:DNA-binding transcriptional MerR regulator